MKKIKESKLNSPYTQIYEEAFVNACKYGMIDVAKWLYSLDNTVHLYSNNYDYNKLIYKPQEVKKWLSSLYDDKYNLRSNKRKREEYILD